MQKLSQSLQTICFHVEKLPNLCWRDAPNRFAFGARNTWILKVSKRSKMAIAVQIYYSNRKNLLLDLTGCVISTKLCALVAVCRLSVFLITVKKLGCFGIAVIQACNSWTICHLRWIVYRFKTVLGFGTFLMYPIKYLIGCQFDWFWDVEWVREQCELNDRE